jgi:hypothetical protein
MGRDPEGDLRRSEVIGSGSFGDALALGGVLVLVAWPLARLLAALGRVVRRRHAHPRS